MPRPASAVPVAAPCERAVLVRPSAPICGGESVGGAHGIRLIEPPSWSTAIRSRRLAAGGRCVAKLLRERAQRGRRRDVPAEQDHAADLAAPDPAEQAGARGRGAVHRHDQALADELGEVRGGRGAGDRRRPGRGREGGGGRGRLGGHGRPEAGRRRGPGGRGERRGHAARDEDDGDERRDCDRARRPAQLADHGCIWIVPGWPGPLHGGTVASVVRRRRRRWTVAMPLTSKAMPTGATAGRAAVVRRPRRAS